MACACRLISCFYLGEFHPAATIMGLVNDFVRMPASLWIVYINVTLYALCYQMQAPVQPHLVKSLGKFCANLF